MLMEPFKYLEHTADAKFQAFGKTMEEAFSNAALAMYNLMVNPETIKPLKIKKIAVAGEDLKDLLYNWLEEFLIALDTEGFLLSKVSKITITKEKTDDGERYNLTAVVNGDDNLEAYDVHGDVKAVTFNEMEIVEKEGECMVQVVVDI